MTGEFVADQRKIVERSALKVCPCCGAELLDVRPCNTRTESWEQYLFNCGGHGLGGSCGILEVFPAPSADAVKHVTVNGEMPEEYRPEEWGIGRWFAHCPAVTWSHRPMPLDLVAPPRRDGWNLPTSEERDE